MYSRSTQVIDKEMWSRIISWTLGMAAPFDGNPETQFLVGVEGPKALVGSRGNAPFSSV